MKITTLPPTDAPLDEHIKSGHLQTLLWKYNNSNNNYCNNNNNYYYIGFRVRFGVQRRHRGPRRLLMKFNHHILTIKNQDEMKFEI